MTLVIRTTGIEDFLDGGQAHIKALILGAPSAGKTRSASFWPDPIFADCEEGRMSIADRAVPYAAIKSTAEMDALLAMLKLECRKPLGDRKYKTLVIDTVDAYQRIVIQERLDSEKKEALSGWGDWGYLDAKMTQFIAKLHQLPMNIVVNVHVKDLTTGDDDSKVTTTGVKLKGDLKDQIAAEFDLVGYMGTYWEAENGERVLKRGIQWHPEPTKPVLKDRSGQLPKWTSVTFSDDDFGNLFATLVSHLDDLQESKQVEELPTDTVITAQPVAPQKGGPVLNAPLEPAAQPRKAAPAKKAAAAAPKAAPVAQSAKITEAVVGEQTPTPVAVPAAPRPQVPAAPKPEVPGAQSAPVQEPTPESASTPEAAPEAAQPAPEAPAEGPMTTEAVADALGGEVISGEPTADEPSTGAPEGAPAEVEAVAGQDVATADSTPSAAFCGTSSNEGEEGQPGAVSGCGVEVDLDADMTQIAMFKTRTYLCPACYAAWRATTKK